MNDLQYDLAEIYSNADDGALLSKDANWHYTRKLSYLTSAVKVLSEHRSVTFLPTTYGYDLRGKKVLDLGCGVGFTSIYFAATGAKSVMGLDASTNKTRAFDLLRSQLPPELQDRIIVQNARLDTIDVVSSFDVIYAQESISHIIDSDLFERLHRMLIPGGILVISDYNNKLFRPYFREISEEWHRFENGPAGQGRHHSVEQPYREVREEMIGEWFPDLSVEETGRLAVNTSGLHGDGLKAAVRAYIDMGAEPDQPYVAGTPPVNPRGGYLMEKVFDPFDLRRQLLAIGFSKCHLRSADGVLSNWWVRAALRVIPLQLKFRIRPGFKLIAIK